LKSPVSQRVRCFALTSQSLNELGCAVEWLVINATDYGMQQRHGNIFFTGCHEFTAIYEQILRTVKQDWFTKIITITSAFCFGSMMQCHNSN
jgi:site-specific DNA-cytosine methylase